MNYPFLKGIKVGSLLLFFLLFNNSLFSQSDYQNNFKWEEYAELPPAPGEKIQHGLASPFAGLSNGAVIVGGGCNFPDVPVRDGGKKKYYDDAYVLTEKNGKPEWLTGFKIPFVAAYGASVSLPEGLLCIGGNNNDEVFRFVFLLKWNDEELKLETENWPDLPYGMTQMGAALIGQTVYVAGGMAGGKPANTFLALDISKKGTKDFKWKELKPFPGPARLQPVVVAQNAAEEKHLYLISGSSFADDKSEPDVTTDGLEFNPKTGKWVKVPEIMPDGLKPFSLHGADAIPLGMNSILFIGGVNRDIFCDEWKKERELKDAKKRGDTATVNRLVKWEKEYLSHDPGWYRFNDQILIYNTITKSWAVGDKYPFPPPAGAKIVPWDDGWLVISGETMPGVRSAKVYTEISLLTLLSGGLTGCCLSCIFWGCCSWVTFLCNGRRARRISSREEVVFPGGLQVCRSLPRC